MFNLNNDQRNAVNKMHEFMLSDEQFFRLEGPAGTGKTTCVQFFAKETDANIVFTAPTNKATRVLEKMCASLGASNVECVTIYKLLGLALQDSGEVRRVEAKGKNSANKFDVVIVDEGSMVSSTLWEFIDETAMDGYVKFIFMQDELQLPPVKENRSIISNLPINAQLKKVERHDNQILTLANHLRDVMVDGVELNIQPSNDSSGGVYCVSGPNTNKQISRAYKSESYKLDPSSFKIIAWKNATVLRYNNYVRSEIYGESDSPYSFHNGERVVICQPVMDLIKTENLTPLFTTDEEAIIEGMEIKNHPIFENLLCYKLILNRKAAWAIHPSSDREYKNMLSGLAKKAREGEANWGQFWYLNNSVHDVRPCHSITAHRSQGSTYNTVFVDAEDILSNRNPQDAIRCLYVACSRASNKLILKI